MWRETIGCGVGREKPERFLSSAGIFRVLKNGEGDGDLYSRLNTTSITRSMREISRLGAKCYDLQTDFPWQLVSNPIRSLYREAIARQAPEILRVKVLAKHSLTLRSNKLQGPCRWSWIPICIMQGPYGEVQAPRSCFSCFPSPLVHSYFISVPVSSDSKPSFV